MFPLKLLYNEPVVHHQPMYQKLIVSLVISIFRMNIDQHGGKIGLCTLPQGCF